MEYDVLKRAIIDVLKVYEKEVTPEAELELGLGADSIDIAHIFRIVENELGIELQSVDLSGVVTVADALEVIRTKKLPAKEAAE